MNPGLEIFRAPARVGTAVPNDPVPPAKAAAGSKRRAGSQPRRKAPGRTP